MTGQTNPGLTTAGRLVPLAELLQAAYAEGYAVPSFCAWSAESILAELRMAADLRAPIILMAGAAEFVPLGPAELYAITRTFLERFPVRVALHLDHGDSVDLARECLDAGFTSVMLDFSSRPFAENAANLRETVELARRYGASVEGELGHVGRADKISVESADDHSTLTDPGEAARYVRETGVDALAVSIGNSHGQYTRLPQFDFGRLAEIRDAVDVPLVLHGGSGTPEADLQRAIALGIAKVNVATDLVRTIRESLREQWAAGRNLWLPMAQAEAMRDIPAVLEKWIRATGAAGRL